MIGLTRDPVADRIGSVVVAAISRTRRGVVSELELTKKSDGVPTDCVVSFDNLHTIPRGLFRRKVADLSAYRIEKLANVCMTLWAVNTAVFAIRRSGTRLFREP
jgi:mRNA interferase MazF